MNTKESHERAMDLCEEVNMKLSEAFSLENSCVEELERLDKRDSLDYVVLCRSAATLAVRSGLWETARILCKKGLGFSDKWPEIKEELSDVLAVSNFSQIRGKRKG